MLATVWGHRFNPVSPLSVSSLIFVGLLIGVCWLSEVRDFRRLVGAIVSVFGAIWLVLSFLPKTFDSVDAVISGYLWGVAACWVGFNAMSSRSTLVATLGGLNLFFLGWLVMVMITAGLPGLIWRHTLSAPGMVWIWAGVVLWPMVFGY